MAKAQVTYFILIGFVLLIVGGVTIYYVQQAQTQIVDEDFDIIEGGIPDRVKSYVDQCLKSATLEGIDRMSKQGLYTQVPQDLPSVDYLGKRVPYWLDLEYEYIPDIDYLVLMFQEFVNYRMDQCMQRMHDDFLVQNIQISYSEIGTQVNLFDKVMVNFRSDIKAEQGEEKYAFENFYFEVPFHMQKVYALIKAIVETELAEGYLELYTENLVSAYSYLDNNALPPRYAFVISTKTESFSWTDVEIENRIKAMLEENIPLLRVQNTKSHRDKWEKHTWTKLNLFDDDFYDFQVDFIFDKGFDTKISVDRFNEESEQTNVPMIPMLNMKEIETEYSIQYPVVVKLKMYDTIEISPNYIDYDTGGEFEFMFAMMAAHNYDPSGSKKSLEDKYSERIENSLKLYGLNETLEFDDGNISFIDQLSYCDRVIANDSTIEKSFTVLDFFSEQPVSGSVIKLKCPESLIGCRQGETNEVGIIKTLLPDCDGLKMQLLHNEYEQDMVGVNESVDTIFVAKPVEINITAEKLVGLDMLLGDMLGKPSENKIDILEDDRVLIVFSDQNSRRQQLIYPTDKTVYLKPGFYNISTMVISNVFLMGIKDPDSGDFVSEPYEGPYVLGMIENEFEFVLDKEIKELYIPVLTLQDPGMMTKSVELGMVTLDENRTLIYNSSYYLPYNRYKEILEPELK